MLDLRGFKAAFFDTAAVRKAAGDAVGRALSRFGAFVRRRAQTSIRKRAGSAPPGAPPHSHEGTLRRLILFAYDATRASVVIGPARGGPATGAPAVLEAGGATTVTAGPNRGAVVPVEARPYMAPAFAAELPNFKTLIR